MLLQNFEFYSGINWSEELKFDDYSPGRYAWNLQEVSSLKYPLPVKGTLGLWNYERVV